MQLPHRGFCVAFHGGGYLACFPDKAAAMKFARTMAKSARRSLDIVQVQNHGGDRFIIDEVFP